LVSVVRPTRNGARFIAAPIESCLVQTYARFELIVVDDGSVNDPGRVLQALCSLEGTGVSAYLDLVGYRLLDGFDISEPYALELPDVLLRAIRVGGCREGPRDLGRRRPDRRRPQQGARGASDPIRRTAQQSPADLPVPRQAWRLKRHLGLRAPATGGARGRATRARQVVCESTHLASARLPSKSVELCLFARRAVAAGNYPLARESLASATMLRAVPGWSCRRLLLAPEGRALLLEGLVADALGPASVEPGAGAVPARLAARWGADVADVRRAMARVAMRSFFEAVATQRPKEAAAHLRAGLRHDPRWLAHLAVMGFAARRLTQRRGGRSRPPGLSLKP
jgi:Glycosyl transferase family 2